MKKGIKNAVIATLLIAPMVMGGCENPFSDSNSIGSGDHVTDVVIPDVPSSGGTSTTPEEEAPPAVEQKAFYNPYDYENGDNPFEEITSNIAYIKSIYKQGSSATNPIIIQQRKESYLNAATNILKRLAGEYGYGYNYSTEIVGGATLKPLSNVSRGTFANAGLLKSEYTASQATMDAIVTDFIGAKYIKTFDISATVKYSIISHNELTGSDILPRLKSDGTNIILDNPTAVTRLASVFDKTVLGVPEEFIASTHYFTENVSFYKATLSSGKEVYLIFNYDFCSNLATKYTKIIDTHQDGIRFNLVSLDSSSSASGTDYNITSKGWAMYETYKSSFVYNGTDMTEYYNKLNLGFQEYVALELATVMTFGLDESGTLLLPSSPVAESFGFTGSIDEFYTAAKLDLGSHFDSYMNFCLTYIEHNGFVAYEADVIAEYLTNTLVGKDILALEANRFHSYVTTEAYQKTFNSNEKVIHYNATGAQEKVIVRKLITDYNNKNVRGAASKKNTYFQAMTLNKPSNMSFDSNSASDTLAYDLSGARTDERYELFKNYQNTMYSVCHSLVSGDAGDISVNYCDIDYSYLQNVTINTEEPEDEEEDTGGEEGEEEEENYITDLEMAGKLQSLVIFPKAAVDIRYIEIGIEGILNDGDSLGITVDLRYCVNGQVFYAANAFTPDGGESELTSEENVINFEYCSGLAGPDAGIGNGPRFRTENNEEVPEKLLSLSRYVAKDDIPDLREKPPIIQWGWEQVPIKSATGAPYAYNKFASSMGASYCYSPASSSCDYIEICFNIKPNYANFDTDYKINAKVTSLYGVKK